jgi:hypothetical protein
MPDETSGPKLHIDSDWKAEAQKEKERLSQREQAKGAKARPGAAAGDGDAGLHELPEPNFRALVGILASQAVMGLGAMGDPQTNRIVIDLEGARFAIDLLGVLEEKTKGNVTEEEARELRQVTAELRNRFVQVSQFMVRQMAAQQAAGAAAPGGPSPGAAKVAPLRSDSSA